jgi:hypothetical protein
MSSELANEREMTAEAKREQKGLALQVQLARQSSSEAKALADDLKRELANEHALRETAHANSQWQRQELEEKALIAEAKQQQLEDELSADRRTAEEARRMLREEKSAKKSLETHLLAVQRQVRMECSQVWLAQKYKYWRSCWCKRTNTDATRSSRRRLSLKQSRCISKMRGESSRKTAPCLPMSFRSCARKI